MRWRKDKKPSPKDGETRSRVVFAWKRTIVGDDIVWLELYEIHERFFIPAGGDQGWWTETGRNIVECYY